MAEFPVNMDWTSNPADDLTDDLVVEILSRVPYKSLCRFKCVCRRWRGIIADPNHRTVLAQYHLGGLDGLIRSTYNHIHDRLIHHYSSFSEGSRLSKYISLMLDHRTYTVFDSCNGLLLCICTRFTRSTPFNYVVYNPATEKSVVLPRFFTKVLPARLGFEPAVSSHFHVFVFEKDATPTVHYWDEYYNNNYVGTDGHIKGVDIYSSTTGVWTHKENCLGTSFRMDNNLKSVFVNGVLYLVAIEPAALVTVDVEGSTWKMIPMPPTEDNPGIGSIDLSQGSLHLARTTYNYETTLSISVLEDHDSSEQWIHKYSIRHFNLFGVHSCPSFSIVAMHPERDTIYIVYGAQNVLISYDMDTKKVVYIQKLAHDSTPPYHPYAPLYLADGHR